MTLNWFSLVRQVKKSTFLITKESIYQALGRTICRKIPMGYTSTQAWPSKLTQRFGSLIDKRTVFWIGLATLEVWLMPYHICFVSSLHLFGALATLLSWWTDFLESGHHIIRIWNLSWKPSQESQVWAIYTTLYVAGQIGANSTIDTYKNPKQSCYKKWTSKSLSKDRECKLLCFWPFCQENKHSWQWEWVGWQYKIRT